MAEQVGLSELAERIKAAHEEAEQHRERWIEYAIAAGVLLLEAKARMPHGRFMRWRRAETGVGDDTAEDYMRAARNPERARILGSVRALKRVLRGTGAEKSPDRYFELRRWAWAMGVDWRSYRAIGAVGLERDWQAIWAEGEAWLRAVERRVDDEGDMHGLATLAATMRIETG